MSSSHPCPVPSDFFGRNMAAIKQHYPLFAEELAKAGDDIKDGELVIETASSGAPTLCFQKLYVHSRRDPEREAERIASELRLEGAAGTGENPALVLGFGLGYTVSALAAKFPAMPIIVVERHPALFKKALETRDLVQLLSGSTLVFVMDPGGVTGALSLFESTPGIPPALFKNRALVSLDEEWYADAEEKIKNWNSRTNVNQATQRRFGKRWVKNLSQNLTAIRDLPGISPLEGILNKDASGGPGDIPVFLAAAGPGLDTVGGILNEISKRCITVAVDTSLRFFTSRGVDPDFAVSLDPQYRNFRHLDRAPAPKTRLVTESAVYPAVMRHVFGGIFLCRSFFPLGRFIESKVEQKGELGAGGSVATSAWDFIRLMGAKTLWIAGLDLAFPDLKTHFSGALFEESSHAESRRFTPAETRNFHSLRDGQPFHAKRMDGGTVLTDKRLSLYASWFENRFYQFPEIKNYSLSGGRLEIKGLESARVDELLALPERRDEINNLLEKAYTSIEKDFSSEEAKKSRSQKYEDARKTLLNGLEEIKNLAEEAADNAVAALALKKQNRLGSEKQDKALKKLDAANKTIAESSVKEVSGFLFPDTSGWEAEIGAEIGAEDTDPLTRHLEFSIRFYQSLAESANFNLKYLAEPLPKLS